MPKCGDSVNPPIALIALIQFFVVPVKIQGGTGFPLSIFAEFVPTVQNLIDLILLASPCVDQFFHVHQAKQDVLPVEIHVCGQVTQILDAQLFMNTDVVY